MYILDFKVYKMAQNTSDYFSLTFTPTTFFECMYLQSIHHQQIIRSWFCSEIRTDITNKRKLIFINTVKKYMDIQSMNSDRFVQYQHKFHIFIDFHSKSIINKYNNQLHSGAVSGWPRLHLALLLSGLIRRALRSNLTTKHLFIRLSEVLREECIYNRVN